MASPSNPRVFLSAVTADVGLPLLDKLAHAIHGDFACVCRYRNNLFQGGQLLVEKLREEIGAADCVIHLVGPKFGFGPLDVPVGVPPADHVWQPDCRTWWPEPTLPARRSFTQMEFDFAMALKKPVFVIFIDDPAVLAAASGQPAAEAALQAAHNAAIHLRGHEYARTDSVTALGDLMGKLPIAIQHLKNRLVERDDALERAAAVASHHGRRNYRLLATLAAGIIVIGSGVGWLIYIQKARAISSSIAEEVYTEVSKPEPRADEQASEARLNAAIQKVAGKKAMTETAVREAVALFVARVYSDPLNQTRAYYLAGDYAAAEKTALTAAGNSRSLLVLAGDAQEKQQHYTEALNSYRRAAALVDERERDAWIDINLKVGVMLWNLAQYEEARQLFRRARLVAEIHYGETDTRLADLLEYEGLQLHYEGFNAEAMELFQRTLTIREKILGAKHPYTGVAVANLALSSQSLGNFVEAERLFRSALPILESTQGAEKSLHVRALATFAALLIDTGRGAEAKPILQRAILVGEQALGPSHPDLAYPISSLAVQLLAEGDFAKAESMARQAVTITENAFGPNHPEVATCLNNLAAPLYREGRFSEAMELEQRAIAIYLKSEGDHASGISRPYYWLARCQQALGQTAAAAGSAQKALTASEKGYGKDHPKTQEIRALPAALEKRE